MQAIIARYKTSPTTGQAYILVSAGDSRPTRYAWSYQGNETEVLQAAIATHALKLGWHTYGKIHFGSLGAGTQVGVIVPMEESNG